MYLFQVFASVGIVFCILGAYFAASGFMKTSNQSLFVQASTHVSYNPHLYESLVHQRDRAVIGFILILLGSMIQLVSLIIDPTIPLNITKRHYYLYLTFSSIFLLIIIEFIVLKIISTKNINTILIEKELSNYRSITKKIEENIRIKTPTNYSLIEKYEEDKYREVEKIAKRLCIKQDGLPLNEFERLVISKAEITLRRNKNAK